jgi:RimJ/RimL family protein N-acetyltransferase
MISCEQRLEYLAFANRVLDVNFEPDPTKNVWLTRLNEDGTIAAVVVYSDFSVHNCEMSVASDGGSTWATRDFLGVCYRYPFNQLGKRRVTAVVESRNTASLRMCRKLGHVEEACLKHWFGADDGIVMRMLKEECKWL